MEPQNGPTLSPRTREQLLDRVSLNRVTIVIGPTGCGKSTLIPSELLDHRGGPVVCTQPRRLAVVAVANRVAENRGAVLGQEVGYHVGQRNESTNKTQLVFATAGILLEDLRANGIQVLERYSTVLIDECHERSSESDLCLTVIRQLMRGHPNADIRIVLMSATFDHQRYKKYFGGVPGCETIDTITLETAESFAAFYNRVETLYLDDFLPKLSNSDSHAELMKTMRKDPDQSLDGKSLSFHLLHLIHSLTEWLDEQEPAESPFLIFAPTYRHLEQLFEHLRSNWNDARRRLVLSVLHSSVDIEDCIRSMKDPYHGQNHPRRVLLSSAIADSSVTIPGVTCVIDTCRSLQVAWDGKRQNTQTVWTSKSICDQRQGRTGRTCAGRVFRLLTKRFFLANLADFEKPRLTLSDCRNEAMSLLSSSASELSDCVALLEKCLDPPASKIIKQAVKFLKDIGACIETTGQRSKLVATEYGLLLATLPFTIADSCAILTAAQHGYLHEMLLLRSIMSIRPSPVVSYFADEHKSVKALQKYSAEVDPKDPMSVSVAHMSAFMFWASRWNAARRQAAYSIFQEAAGSPAGRQFTGKSFLSSRDLLYGSEDMWMLRDRLDCGVWHWTQTAEETHAEWCRKHDINPTSVRTIEDTMDVTMKILFQAKFEPEWLRCCPTEPGWCRKEYWKLEPMSRNYTVTHMLRNVYGAGNDTKLCRKLQEFAFPGSVSVALNEVPVFQLSVVPVREACVHFLSGSCKFGERCKNAHSLHAKRPLCRFFLIGQCTNGNRCLFAHDGMKDGVSSKANKCNDPLKPIAPQDISLSLPNGALGWFAHNAVSLVLLGENNFRFSCSLASLGFPPKLSTELQKIDKTSHHFKHLDPSRVRGGVDATRVHADIDLVRVIGSGEWNGFAWNFPFTGSDEDELQHEDLVSATFLSMALCAPARTGRHDPLFGIALQGDQFSRWSVLRSARRAGWQLKAWSAFNHEDFPGYRPSRANGDAFPYENGRFYVFQLHERIL